MDPRIGHLTRFTSRRRAAPPAGIPSSPPRDVLWEVEDAAARVDELHAAQRDLHFELDETTGRVSIELRDLDGRAIRDVAPSEALDIVTRRTSGPPAV
jgi:hypothetical protein